MTTRSASDLDRREIFRRIRAADRAQIAVMKAFTAPLERRRPTRMDPKEELQEIAADLLDTIDRITRLIASL